MFKDIQKNSLPEDDYFKNNILENVLEISSSNENFNQKIGKP